MISRIAESFEEALDTEEGHAVQAAWGRVCKEAVHFRWNFARMTGCALKGQPDGVLHHFAAILLGAEGTRRAISEDM